jgi:hypothetical protein
LILISSTCGGLHLSHPKIIGVATYRRCLLGKWASGIRGSRDAEKLKASQDEGAEVQKDEEEYHYHDGHQYEVVSTHNTRPSVAYFPTYGYAEPTYRSPPVYAASCMCIRPVLRAVTIPSDGSTDLTESEGKTHLKKGIRRPP